MVVWVKAELRSEWVNSSPSGSLPQLLKIVAVDIRAAFDHFLDLMGGGPAARLKILRTKFT